VIAAGELRQQAREEGRHLRVRHVADQALPECAAGRDAGAVAAVQRGPPAAERCEQRLDAEEREIAGADHLERDERRL